MTRAARLPGASRDPLPSQGFEVLGTSFANIGTGQRTLPVKRLVTRMGARVEPLTYWTTVGDTHAIQYQSSTSSSGTRVNSRRLCVTSLCPCRRAIAAISRSVGPIGVPAASS